MRSYLTLCDYEFAVPEYERQSLDGKNKSANGVFCDAGHRLRRGVLHFQNVVRFHGARVNVTSLTPIRKGRSSLRRFSRNSQKLEMCRSLILNFAKIGKQMRKARI
jgi:hypothetical protein